MIWLLNFVASHPTLEITFWYNGVERCWVVGMKQCNRRDTNIHVYKIDLDAHREPEWLARAKIEECAEALSRGEVP